MSSTDSRPGGHALVYGTRFSFIARALISYRLLERAYSSKNPFNIDGKDTPMLVLGSKCASCSEPVCVGMLPLLGISRATSLACLGGWGRS